VGSPAIEILGVRAVPELAVARVIEPRAERLEALRDAASALRRRLREQGTIRAVRSVDLFGVPAPSRFVLGGAARALAPWVALVRRLVVVQYDGFDGDRRTLLWEPAFARRDGAAVAERVAGRELVTVAEALARCGLAPERVDYVGVGCLHGHDLRRLVGTTEPVAGEHQSRAGIAPGAALLCQRRELDAARSLHPVRRASYVQAGLAHVDEAALVPLDGDVELGVGVALVATPGRSAGHQSLVLRAPDGVWVCSRNGVAADAWQPQLSKIPGVRAYTERWQREVAPEAEPVEDVLDLYDSMVVEKGLADANRTDPRWLNVLPTSELAPWRRQWPLVPTFQAGGIEFGRIAG
jgi:hypothetical protein